VQAANTKRVAIASIAIFRTNTISKTNCPYSSYRLKYRRSTMSPRRDASFVTLAILLYIKPMKALVITPKDEAEFKFVSVLLKKLGLGSSALSQDEIEDIALSRMMFDVDKSKKASRSQIMKKLSA